MALTAHWRARDAAGVGSTLPELIGNRDGTLSGGCSWTEENGELAVRIPPGESVSITDDALWTLGDFTVIVRLLMHTKLSGPSGDHSFAVHGTRWRISVAGDSESVWVEWENPGGTPRSGGGVFFSYAVATLYSIAVTRSGADFELLVNGVSLGTNSGASEAFLNTSSALTIGSATANLSLISLRFYDTVLSDAAIFEAMIDDVVTASTRLTEDDELRLSEAGDSRLIEDPTVVNDPTPRQGAGQLLLAPILAQ